jgi:hypothetical protein
MAPTRPGKLNTKLQIFQISLRDEAEVTYEGQPDASSYAGCFDDVVGTPTIGSLLDSQGQVFIAPV